MKPVTGLILRRVGLLIEFTCLVLFVTTRDRHQMVAGIEMSRVLIAGVAIGFVLWVVGLVRIRSSARLPTE